MSTTGGEPRPQLLIRVLGVSYEFGVVLLDELMDFLRLAPLQLVESPGLVLAAHKGDPVAYLFGGPALIGQ
ncbi:hypothetical protein [Mycobacterium sp. NPDC050853]|uniref:hypothetical protein n=1 Tax=Mycobacterium sp. NPDC050853 TaxID=3155160 RepID=UPI00340356B0